MRRRILLLSLFTLVAGLLTAQTFEARNCEQFDPFENSTYYDRFDTDLADAAALTVTSLPAGRPVRVIAAPELEFSPQQVMEFPVEVRDEHVYAKALIFLGQVEDIEGNRRRLAGSTPTSSNPFGGSNDDPFGDIRSRVPD